MAEQFAHAVGENVGNDLCNALRHAVDGGERVGHHGINVLESTAMLAIGATKFVACVVAGTFALVAALDVAKVAIRFKNASEVRPQHSL